MDYPSETCTSVVGLCQTMCSENEIELRESERLLHWLEMEGGRNSKEYRADRNLVIKQYLRPAAGKNVAEPAELRPGPVLLKTTTHLIKNVIPICDCQWYEIYEFVFDRLRAVRQDMTIQQIEDSYGVRILEHAIRIMVYAQYRLCEETVAHFDQKINATHIQESLKKLLILYEYSSNCHCNMAEFVSLYLVFNLGSTEALQYGLDMKQRLKFCKTCIDITWICACSLLVSFLYKLTYQFEQEIHPEVRKCIIDNTIFKSALAVSLAWNNSNYFRCLKISHNLPVLHLCALHNNIHILIRQSLSIMCHGYNSKNLLVSLNEISRILHLNGQEHAKIVCELCGLEVVSGKGVRFLKTSFKPNCSIPRTFSHFIDEILEGQDLVSFLLGNICQCLPSETR